MHDWKTLIFIIFWVKEDPLESPKLWLKWLRVECLKLVCLNLTTWGLGPSPRRKDVGHPVCFVRTRSQRDSRMGHDVKEFGIFSIDWVDSGLGRVDPNDATMVWSRCENRCWNFGPWILGHDWALGFWFMLICLAYWVSLDLGPWWVLGVIWRIGPYLGFRWLFWNLGLWIVNLSLGYGPSWVKGKKIFYPSLDT